MTVALCPNCFKELSDLRGKEDRIDYFCNFCNEAISSKKIITNVEDELKTINEQVKVVMDFLLNNNVTYFHPIAKDLLRRFL